MLKIHYYIILFVLLLSKFAISGNPSDIHFKILDKKFLSESVKIRLVLISKDKIFLKSKFKEKKCNHKISIKTKAEQRFDFGLIFDRLIGKDQMEQFRRTLLKSIKNNKNFHFYLLRKKRKPINFLTANLKIPQYYNDVTTSIKNKRYPFYIFIGSASFITQVKSYLNKRKEKIYFGFISINRPSNNQPFYKNTLFDFRQGPKLAENLRKFFQKLNNSCYVINFNPCYPNSNKMTIIVQAFFHKKKISEFPLSIFFPDSFLKKYRHQYIQSEIKKFANNRKYKDALNTLLKHKSLFLLKNYNEKVKEIFTTWANNLFKRKNSNPTNIFEYIQFAESKFHLIHQKWYQGLKIKLLQYQLKLHKNDKYTIKILETLHKLIPNNRDITYQYLQVLAETQYKKGNFVSSLSNYLKAEKIKKDPSISSVINSLLLRLFQNNFGQKEYNKIYTIGSKYQRYFNKNFELIFYFAKSCENVSDYKCAMKYYEFLFENWRRNKFITWEKLLKILQQNSLYNFQFDASYNYLKRAYRLNNNPDLLNLAVALLRAKYLYAYLLFFKRTIKLTSIQIDEKILNALFNKKFNYFDYALVYNVKNANELMIKVKNNNLSLYSRINGRKYIKINILTDKKSTREKEIINNIQKFPKNENFWDKLFSYEYFNDYDNTGVKILSYLLTNLFSSEFNKIDLNKYNISLRKIPYLKYIVIHNNQGKIVTVLNFNKSSAVFPHNGWKKSSKTLGFYKQSVIYGKMKIIDIALPIYIRTKWSGAIRFGYRENIF